MPVCTHMRNCFLSSCYLFAHLFFLVNHNMVKINHILSRKTMVINYKLANPSGEKLSSACSAFRQVEEELESLPSQSKCFLVAVGRLSGLICMQLSSSVCQI